MNFTPAQREAIAARGDTLVIAGAGTGKTRTLVEHCVQRLLDGEEEIGIDEILVVTFTEAAAAEIRQRVRLRLEEEWEHNPDTRRLTGQLALLDTAHISTLHGFCLKLVREHFHELALDPELTVLADEAAALLAEETMEALFEAHYTGKDAESEAVRNFLQVQARGWEARVRELIMELHHFTQTRPDPEGWFGEQLARFENPEPVTWRRWFREGFEAWRNAWLPILEGLGGDNPNARRCWEILGRKDGVNGGDDSGAPSVQGREVEWSADTGRLVREIEEVDRAWPKGKKGVLREPIKKLFEEAAYWEALCPEAPEGGEPLREDWTWAREPMITLLKLGREFGVRFAEAKRQRGGVDFHDLEQFALRLLWEPAERGPTALAREWRAKLKLVFVDEYQDINEAQDTILTALSREGAEANRFLVGDVKQSIYRFRQAAPHIFQDYAGRWDGQNGRGRSLFLSDNFRSRQALLEFINCLFAALMRKDVGGVDYDERTALQFGDPAGRAALSIAASPGPEVEVLLRIEEKSEDGKTEEDDSDPVAGSRAELSETETEARRVAMRLRELKASGHEVWDEESRAMRGVDWKDMVILLRSPKSKVESFAKEFARLGVPLEAKRTGFFQSIEVRDLLNLLNLLDNPLQDLAAVGVLHSPLAGLTLDELARLRLAVPKQRFWTALNRWRELNGSRFRVDGLPAPEETSTAREADAILFQKVDTFLKRFEHWRAQSRQTSLSRRIEMILEETFYRDWLWTQDRAEQRQANVAYLLALAREYDTLSSQGLHRFLRMIEAQREAAGDREPAPVETGNAVRLMSIHQSKGLEFPVVVVADLGKRFNLRTSRSGMVLDEQFGLCPQVRPPNTERTYPSLPLWLARRRQRAEALGEELRVLYVALSRARDKLILSAHCSAKRAHETWIERASQPVAARSLLSAESYLDWIGPWLTGIMEGRNWTEQAQGQGGLFSWSIYQDAPGLDSPAVPKSEGERSGVPVEDALKEEWEGLQRRLAWKYANAQAVRAPAKSSVTRLRRLSVSGEEEAQPASFLVRGRFESDGRDRGGLSAGEIGSAHHKFLQWMSLDTAGSTEELEKESRRLEEAGLLSWKERSALRLPDLVAFWQSEVGRQIRGQAQHVRRELPFTCRLTDADVQRFPLPPVEAVPAEEFIVVQGVIDLAVVMPDQVWLLDFKTDRFGRRELADKVARYRPQLHFYRLALNRIYRRGVTRCWLHFLGMGETVSL
jgi:ATP-dependent helicase/nuclease subunit A